MLDGPVRFALIAVVTAAAVAGLNWLSRRAKPLNGDPHKGTIRPDRITASITVLFGLLMAAGGTVGLFGGGGFQAGAILAFGVVMAGFMAPSLSNMHAVNWNSTGIEGPSKTFGLTLGSSRALIVWWDLVGSGKTASGYWYFEASDGQRVYWSYLYRGHGALTATIKKHRPNSDLPEDA